MSAGRRYLAHGAHVHERLLRGFLLVRGAVALLLLHLGLLLRRLRLRLQLLLPAGHAETDNRIILQLYLRCCVYSTYSERALLTK